MAGIMTYRMMMMAALACAPLVTACAGDDSVQTGEPQFSTLVEHGFHATHPDGKLFDIEVAGDVAYVVNGELGVNQIEVVDLERMEVVDTIAPNDELPATDWADGRRGNLELSGVQLADGQLVVYGRRDDAYPINPVDDFLGQGAPWRFSFVVQGLTDGGEVDWSVGLDLRGAVDPSSALVQREKMSAYVQGDTIAITFSHIEQPDMVVTLPKPDGHAMYQLVDHPSVAMPVAPVAELGHIETPRGTAVDDEGRVFVAASGGLYRTDENGAVRLADLPFDEGHYLVDVQVKDGLAYGLDDDGRVHVMSAKTGNILETVDTNVWAQSLSLSDEQVFISSLDGFYVFDIRWTAPTDEDDVPVGGDDDEEEEEDDTETGCGWLWWLCL